MDQNNGKPSNEKFSNEELKMKALNRLRLMEWKRNQSEKWHLERPKSRNEMGQGDNKMTVKSDCLFSAIPERTTRNKTCQKKVMTEQIFLPQREKQLAASSKENAWEKKKGSELFLREEDQEEKEILKRVIAESLRTAEEDKKRAKEREQLLSLETDWNDNFSLPSKELKFIETEVSDEEFSESTSKKKLPPKPQCSRKQEKYSENVILEVDNLESHMATLNIIKGPVEDKRMTKEKPIQKSKSYELSSQEIENEQFNDGICAEHYMQIITNTSIPNLKEQTESKVFGNVSKLQEQNDLQAQAQNYLEQLKNSVPKNSPSSDTLFAIEKDIHTIQKSKLPLKTNEYQNHEYSYYLPDIYNQYSRNVPGLSSLSPNLPYIMPSTYTSPEGYLPQYSHPEVTQPLTSVFHQQQYSPYAANLPEARSYDMKNNNETNNILHSFKGQSKTLMAKNRYIPTQLQPNSLVSSAGNLYSNQQNNAEMQNNAVQDLNTADMLKYLMNYTERLLQENLAGLVRTEEQINSHNQVLPEGKVNSPTQLMAEDQDHIIPATQYVPHCQIDPANLVLPLLQSNPFAETVQGAYSQDQCMLTEYPQQHQMFTKYPQYHVSREYPQHRQMSTVYPQHVQVPAEYPQQYQMSTRYLQQPLPQYPQNTAHNLTVEHPLPQYPQNTPHNLTVEHPLPQYPQNTPHNLTVQHPLPQYSQNTPHNLAVQHPLPQYPQNTPHNLTVQQPLPQYPQNTPHKLHFTLTQPPLKEPACGRGRGRIKSSDL